MSVPAGGLSLERRDGVVVVRLSGEVDLDRAGSLHDPIAAGIQGAAGVVLDLSRVGFLDSGGVRLLDRIAERCAASAVPLRVVAPETSAAALVLRICAFDQGLMAASVLAATAAVRAG